MADITVEPITSSIGGYVHVLPENMIEPSVPEQMIGSTADRIVGMPRAKDTALLFELLE